MIIEKQRFLHTNRYFKVLLTGVILTFVLVGGVFLWKFLANLREEALLASCRPIRLYDLALQYAEKHQGMFPPLSPVPGRLIYDSAFLKGHLHIVHDHVCDAAPDPPDLEVFQHNDDAYKRIDDWSYVYLGYVIENEMQLAAFAEAYEEVVQERGNFTSDLTVPMGQGNCGGDTIYRLRKPEALLEILPCLADRLDQIPVVIEWPGHHADGVSTAVFLGATRQKRLSYPGEWPYSEEAITLLKRLDVLE